MVGVFGAGMAVHFNPKDLGLSVGIFRIVLRQSGLGLWIVFGRSGAELLCLFWAVSGQIVGLLIGPCVLFLVSLLKMNNMLVVCKLC